MSNPKENPKLTETTPEQMIAKGLISIADNVTFKYSHLVANIFGHNYQGNQKGEIKHPMEAGKSIWFPKFYTNAKMNNQISEDGTEILEIDSVPEKRHPYFDKVMKQGLFTRLVFPQFKDPSGGNHYRFMGEFKLDVEASSVEKGLIWRRISTSAKTYPPQK
ncbi:MAG: hypothetical protein HYZ54_08010 [Ignavibacteriae bacterium]|nr:hypothetical protein [Ignavibacteriota bacterium]